MTSNDNRWRTASHSGGEGGNCVQVGNDARRVLVRDTKDRTGPALAFSPEAWRTFTDRAKDL
jgi:hypothetical protein